MPDILFASNNISHWPLSRLSNNAATFDAARVPYSFELQKEESINSPSFIPATGNVTWVHFRMLFEDLADSETFFLIKAYDINGSLLYQIDKRTFINTQAMTTILVKTDAGDITSQQTFPFNEDIMNSVDVRYENNGTNLVSLKLYVNGGLAANANHVGTFAGKGQPAFFSLGCVFSAFTGSTNCYFSEVIVATGDTRNARLDLVRPLASGGETDWVGLAISLGDDDPTTGMTSITPEERQTLQMSTYNGATNISAVVIASQSMSGENGPQNLRHTVRMSTVNYDGPDDLPLGPTLQYNLTDFKINPATSLPWVGGDMPALEMGFVSKA